MLLIFLISIISMWLSVFFPQLLLGINQGIFADKLVETESVSIIFSFLFKTSCFIPIRVMITGKLLYILNFKIPRGSRKNVGDIFSKQLNLKEKKTFGAVTKC